MNRTLGKLLVTGLGTGYLPLMPGTWGSLAIAGAYLLLCRATGGSMLWVSVAMGGVLVASSIACVGLGPFAERAFGRKDPSRCSVDEFAGQALAYLALPVGSLAMDWWIGAGVGLLYFRVFDVVKPPPARRLERLPHGWGVLADDLMAGLYANVAAQISLYWCYFGHA